MNSLYTYFSNEVSKTTTKTYTQLDHVWKRYDSDGVNYKIYSKNKKSSP